jgi:hypothetical protein
MHSPEATLYVRRPIKVLEFINPVTLAVRWIWEYKMSLDDDEPTRRPKIGGI